MANTVPYSPVLGSRLARLLTSFNLADMDTAALPFTHRLAQLIDLPDSILLSDTHGKLAKIKFEPTPVTGHSIKDDFLRAQAAIVEYIAKGFSPKQGLARIKLPAMQENAPIDAATACEPYLMFYAAHQRQLELKIDKLQLRLTDAISGLSPRLAQLATLDAVLGDTLLAYSRRAFNQVPKLLRGRFEHLLSEYHLAAKEPEGGQPVWPQVLEVFLGDMRAVLLAETETRLLPLLALVETIDEDTDRNEYE